VVIYNKAVLNRSYYVTGKLFKPKGAMNKLIKNF